MSLGALEVSEDVPDLSPCLHLSTKEIALRIPPAHFEVVRPVGPHRPDLRGASGRRLACLHGASDGVRTELAAKVAMADVHVASANMQKAHTAATVRAFLLFQGGMAMNVRKDSPNSADTGESPARGTRTEFSVSALDCFGRSLATCFRGTQAAWLVRRD